MINIYDYYELKLNIINLDKSKIIKEKLKKLLYNIQNNSIYLQKWDIIFYIQQILLPILTSIPDTEEKQSFIIFLLNTLFEITDFNYDDNEKVLLNDYIQINSKQLQSSNSTNAIKQKIQTIEDILQNTNYSNNDKNYIYFYIKEKLRQTLVQEYNRLSQQDFYNIKDKIAAQLIIVKQNLKEIKTIDKQLQQISFISYELDNEEEQ